VHLPYGTVPVKSCGVAGLLTATPLSYWCSLRNHLCHLWTWLTVNS